MGGSSFALRPEAAARLQAALASRSSMPPDALLAPLLRERILLEVGRSRSRAEAFKSACVSALVQQALRLAERGPSRRRMAGRLLHVARWSIVLFGWSETVRAWERRYRQPADEQSCDSQELELIDRTVRLAAARSLGGHECKERALTCLALVRTSGMAAELVIGITEPPLRAHVWVEAGETVVSDDPDNCQGYARVARYAGTGTPERP
jgi:hypothetical protein